MNEMKFCQSCGMPLTDEIDSHSVAELNLLGTNADGSKSEDYASIAIRMVPSRVISLWSR